MWFHGQESRIGRECLVPEVSRSFHYGTTGAHINTLLAHAHITGKPVVAQESIQIHYLDR